MSALDEDTPKYSAGFRAAVKALLGPKPHGWSTTYGDEAAVEQLLRRAYHEGRIDGVTAALGPTQAPAAVDVEEEPQETREQVYTRLELFEAAATPPVLTGQILAPLEGDPFAWAVRQARANLGLSLVEATEFVMGVMG